jgi:hypothetical protein
MTEYTNAQYIKNSLTCSVDSISVYIHGVPWTVPICPGNTDYDNMMILVESGDLIIQPAQEANP